MARRADKTDSYMAMVLDLNGRVRAADLQSLPAEARVEALRAFAAAHGGQMELHVVGDELVAGPLVAPVAQPISAAEFTPAPQAEPTSAADLTPDGQSAIDLLLGDYDGTPAPGSFTTRVATPSMAAGPAASMVAAPGAAGPGAAAPGGAPTMRAASAPLFADGLPHDTDRSWLLWWIPTLLVPLVGGAAGWFFLRRSRSVAARAMLATALVLGVVASVAWLRYAGEIGARVNQRGSQTVIVLPSK